MTTILAKPGLTLLKGDPEAPPSLPSGQNIRVVAKPTAEIAAHGHNLFVLTTATLLGNVSAFVSAANKRNQLRALFVRYDMGPEWVPQMFELANLRTMRNTIIHSDFQVPSRILRAWQANAQEELIADAKVAGEDLFIVSCEPETYRVPFASVPTLRRMPVEERSNFRLAADGSYLHWPVQDIHLDLDALLVAIEPERRSRAEKVKRAYGRRYGEAIARLRTQTGLRQSDIEGLSEREVRRIESGGEATVDSLRKLAAAHQMDLPAYLDKIAVLAHESDKGMAADRSSSSYQVVKKK
jgi:hypothetical protein